MMFIELFAPKGALSEEQRRRLGEQLIEVMSAGARRSTARIGAPILTGKQRFAEEVRGRAIAADALNRLESMT
jgi:hypothetical protein